MSSEQRANADITDPIVQLQRRIAELEEHVVSKTKLLHLVLDHLPMAIFWKSREMTFLGGNQHFASNAGCTVDQLIGKTDYDMPWRDEAELYRGYDRQVMERDTAVLNYEEPLVQADGKEIWLRTSKVPLHNTDGELIGILGMFENITQSKAEETERLRQQEEIIRVQAAAIDELSTPLIPLSENVVVMPLIGMIDSRRAQQVLETLLQGISASSAEYAILDITGVPVVDTQVANALAHAATAVKLLGAQVILTGIRPEVAQTIVGLGMQFEQIVTRSTLQSGIAYARDRGAL